MRSPMASYAEEMHSTEDVGMHSTWRQNVFHKNTVPRQRPTQLMLESVAPRGLRTFLDGHCSSLGPRGSSYPS